MLLNHGTAPIATPPVRPNFATSTIVCRDHRHVRERLGRIPNAAVGVRCHCAFDKRIFHIIDNDAGAVWDQRVCNSRGKYLLFANGVFEEVAAPRFWHGQNQNQRLPPLLW